MSDTNGDLFRTPVTQDDILKIFRHWCRCMNKERAFLDPARTKAIEKALKFGATIPDCMMAIEGCRASRWHMGENDRHTPYNDLALILRDAQHIEQFCEIAQAARARRAKEQERRQEFDGPKRGMPEWVREKARHLRLLKTDATQSSMDFADVRRAS